MKQMKTDWIIYKQVPKVTIYSSGGLPSPTLPQMLHAIKAKRFIYFFYYSSDPIRPFFKKR